MDNEVHLRDNTSGGVQAAKLLMVVTDQPFDVSGIILRDLSTEQPIHYLHEPQEVLPSLIFWNVITNKKGQDPRKKPHLCRCKWKQQTLKL